MTSPNPQPETCLRCNADLLPDDEHCPRCGWVNHYRTQPQQWHYQSNQQWQPTTMEPLTSVEGVGNDERPGLLGRVYSWLLAPERRAFTVAGVAGIILLLVAGYYMAQGGSKPYPGLIIATTSPPPATAPIAPTAISTANALAEKGGVTLPGVVVTPFTFAPGTDNAAGGFNAPNTPIPGPPTATPSVAHYDVNPAAIHPSHILTVTTDAGPLTFVLFYDAAPATVQRLTDAIDRELLTDTEIRHDPDFRLLYLAASKSSSEVSYEQNNLPPASGALVDDPGTKWSDYTPVTIAVVEDPATLQRARPLVVYGRLVGSGIPSAARHITDVSYVICSSSDQQTELSTCSLTYDSSNRAH